MRIAQLGTGRIGAMHAPILASLAPTHALGFSGAPVSLTAASEI